MGRLQGSEQEITDMYRQVFEGHFGEQVLDDLSYHFYEPVGYAPGTSKPEDAVFFAGQRHVVAFILERLKDPVVHEVEDDG